MKTITKIALIGGLLATGIAFAATNPAMDTTKASEDCHHGKHSKMWDEGKYLDRMTERLKLTPDQRTSVQSVLQKSKPQMTILREKMQANRKALREVKQSGKGDANQVQTLAHERGELIAEKIIQRSKIRGDIQQILTDTQMNQMKQMHEKRDHQNKG
ncbi:MAG: Spy/CpxP family protein refolding chaperone [Nitrosospira sp.]